ncbi:hypothetical protein [Xanthovirga aplysinae]|uniref:hypothetical protein n=1 Tax=Xanthovirga aplysinae TaxID=2529853 RepID=UPI0012BC51AB|nr:hypothetical protein [Xanthovirga aplysinae]MTI32293.1 hypothetical protein [Xanthovirga aplysinae]
MNTIYLEEKIKSLSWQKEPFLTKLLTSRLKYMQNAGFAASGLGLTQDRLEARIKRVKRIIIFSSILLGLKLLVVAFIFLGQNLITTYTIETDILSPIFWAAIFYGIRLENKLKLAYLEEIKMLRHMLNPGDEAENSLS